MRSKRGNVGSDGRPDTRGGCSRGARLSRRMRGAGGPKAALRHLAASGFAAAARAAALYCLQLSAGAGEPLTYAEIHKHTTLLAFLYTRVIIDYNSNARRHITLAHNQKVNTFAMCKYSVSCIKSKYLYLILKKISNDF